MMLRIQKTDSAVIITEKTDDGRVMHGSFGQVVRRCGRVVIQEQE